MRRSHAGVTKRLQAFEASQSRIDSSLDSLVAISPDAMVTDTNKALIKVTTIRRETVIGTPFSGYFIDPEKAGRIYQLAFEQGMAEDYPLTLRHRGWTLTEVLYNASASGYAGGNVRRVFTAAQHMTNGFAKG